MGFREEYGGMLEAGLNLAVDSFIEPEKLKALADEQLEQARVAVHKLIDEELVKIKAKLKANIIDKIDGEDDVPDA